MSIFDVPIARCEVMHAMVITDQTQRQCACEHGCPVGMLCPLQEAFTGVEWQNVVHAESPDQKERELGYAKRR